MSLINDALRKARREAAERDAEARGATYRPPRAHLPPERRGGLAIGLVIGLALALAGAGAGWYLASRDEPEPTTVSAAVSLPAVVDVDPGAETAEAAAPAAEPRPRPEAAVPVTAVEPASPQLSPGAVDRAETLPALAEATEQRPPEQAGAEALAAEVLAPAEQVASAVPEPPIEAPPPTVQAAPRAEETAPAFESATLTGSPAEPSAGSAGDVQDQSSEAAALVAVRTRAIREPARTGRVEPDVYVLEADVDGNVLRLDFIIYSSTAPFAQINGEQIAAGQTIDGWAVVAVEREQVLLRRGDREVVLRVR